MTLQERFEKAHDAALKAHEREQEKASAEKLEEKAQQLRDARESVDSNRGRRDALRRHGFPVSWPDPSKLRVALAAYEAAFEKDTTGGGAEFSKLAKALSKFADEAQASVAGVVASARKDLQKEDTALRSFKDVEGFGPRVVQAQRAIDTLLAQDWPGADGAVLERILKDRKGVLGQIESVVHSDVPEEVRKFFTAARGDGAALKSLTTGVREWLETHGHLDRVRVVLKG